jgi:hypothetical protein
MSVRFIFDDRGIKQFAKDLQTMERKHRVATAFYLNEQAFGHREALIKDVFPKKMTIRNRTFLRRALQVQRTGTRTPTAAQEALSGSVSIPGAPSFTGWIEQQHGRQGKRKHVGLVAARGGSRKRAILRRNRMLRGKRFQHPQDVSGKFKNKHHRAVAFVAIMQRTKALRNAPFILAGHDSLSDGLYVLRGAKKRPMRVQSFEVDNSVKTVRWSQLGVKAMARRTPPDAMWKRIWIRVIFGGKR